IARPTRSAIRRSELGWTGLDACPALAGRRRERPLSRSEPGNGVAARPLSRADAEELARPGGGTLAADDRPSAGDARGAAAVLAADRPRPMAATGAARRRRSGGGLRPLPARPPASSAGAGANSTDPTGPLVLCRGDSAWRGIDAGADLPRSLP